MKKRIVSLLVLVILIALTGCGLTVPRPEIKEGEFDFSVTYEYKGETKSVSGVYACEYNGTYWALDGGYHRDWSGYIKSDGIEDHIELGVAEDGAIVILVLDLYPDYFMGETYYEPSDVSMPYIMIKSYDEDGGMRILYEADIIEQNYGARIVSYEYDAPIENTFALFK